MIKSYKEALEKIFREENISKYTLDNIKKGLNLLGNPQNNFKIIHIAGTNGKGSVSKMLFSVLKESGKKIGVFTSPHLIDIRERFEDNNGLISEEQFVKILNTILDLNIELSYFDKCVLIAFEFFKLQKNEYVILEVGVGGRIDTTNIVNPIITAIVSIGLDHQHILGNTLEKIAFEKAGIIKQNIPLVLNFKNEIIEKNAKQKNAKIIFTNRKIETNLLGEFQKNNAGIAFEIANFLEIDKRDILNGLQKVKHSGRMEFIKSNLLIDGAHNEDSIRELGKYIKNNLENKFDNIFYCFSIKKGKNINFILNNIGKNNNFILVDIENEMLENLEKHKEEYEIKTKKEILDLQKQNSNNLYVVFGSLYMIGEFL